MLNLTVNTKKYGEIRLEDLLKQDSSYVKWMIENNFKIGETGIVELWMKEINPTDYELFVETTKRYLDAKENEKNKQDEGIKKLGMSGYLVGISKGNIPKNTSDQIWNDLCDIVNHFTSISIPSHFETVSEDFISYHICRSLIKTYSKR